MIKSFKGAVGQEAYSKGWLYRKKLRDLDMHFDPPKIDTCSFCDKSQIQLQNSPNQAQTDLIENEKLLHVVLWESAYEALRADVAESEVSRNLVTVTVDLEQV
jgi:hypothetical protein